MQIVMGGTLAPFLFKPEKKLRIFQAKKMGP